MFTRSRVITLLAIILGKNQTRMFTRSRLTTLLEMSYGRDHTQNAYPQLLNTFTRNDLG